MSKKKVAGSFPDFFALAVRYSEPCVFKADSRKLCERIVLDIDRRQGRAKVSYGNTQITAQNLKNRAV